MNIYIFITFGFFQDLAKEPGGSTALVLASAVLNLVLDLDNSFQTLI